VSNVRTKSVLLSRPRFCSAPVFVELLARAVLPAATNRTDVHPRLGHRPWPWALPTALCPCALGSLPLPRALLTASAFAALCSP